MGMHNFSEILDDFLVRASGAILLVVVIAAVAAQERTGFWRRVAYFRSSYAH